MPSHPFTDSPAFIYTDEGTVSTRCSLNAGYLSRWHDEQKSQRTSVEKSCQPFTHNLLRKQAVLKILDTLALKDYCSRFPLETWRTSPAYRDMQKPHSYLFGWLRFVPPAESGAGFHPRGPAPLRLQPNHTEESFMLIRDWSCMKATILTVVASTILGGVVFMSTPVTEHNRGFDSDGMAYGVMAGEASFPSFLGRSAPWCYRILTPYLASLLPFDTLSNFRVLAFLSNVMSILVFTLILEVLRFPPAFRIFGVLLYAGSFWTLKFSFYSPAYIDYQTQLLLLLVIYLTLRQAYIFLPLVFIVAALQKESLAAYSVFSVIHILRYGNISRVCLRVASVLTILLLPFATLSIVRLAVHAQNPYSPTIMMSHLRQALDPLFWPILLQAVFSGLGIIPIVLLVNYESWVRFLRCHCEWLIYAIISFAFLIGGVDKARLFLYILPLAVILAVCNVEAFKRYASPVRLVLWGCAFLVVHWYIGGYLSSMGRFSEYIARMVPEHSDGRYVPYLIRNLCAGLAIFIFTILFVFREWHFRPTIGFTRRDAAPSAVFRG
jgi:hypothetical protein